MTKIKGEATQVEVRHHKGYRLSKEETIALWDAYAADRSDENRNRIIENYHQIVKYAAERIHARLPAEVELDDLISAGLFGLMNAIGGYEPSRGIKFETYAAPRVRGSILDELRAMDWVPRLVRSRSTKLTHAVDSLRNDLGREPDDKELRQFLKITKADVAKLREDGKPTGTVSLSRKWFETDSNKDVREIDVLEDRTAVNPLHSIARADLKELICKGLSRAERLIIVLYYFEELTMREIGETLDLSESRVSQVHSSILLRLKAKLSGSRTALEDMTTNPKKQKGLDGLDRL